MTDTSKKGYIEINRNLDGLSDKQVMSAYVQYRRDLVKSEVVWAEWVFEYAKRIQIKHNGVKSPMTAKMAFEKIFTDLVEFINSTSAGEAHESGFDLKKDGPMASAYRRCLASLGFGFDLTASEYSTCSKLMKANKIEAAKRKTDGEASRVLSEMSAAVAEQTGFVEGTDEHTAAFEEAKTKLANGDSAGSVAIEMHEQKQLTFAQSQGEVIAAVLQECLDAGVNEVDVIAKVQRMAKELKETAKRAAKAVASRAAA